MNGKPVAVRRLLHGDRIIIPGHRHEGDTRCLVHWEEFEGIVIGFSYAGGRITVHCEKVGDPSETVACSLDPDDVVKRLGHGLAMTA